MARKKPFFNKNRPKPGLLLGRIAEIFLDLRPPPSFALQQLVVEQQRPRFFFSGSFSGCG
jgi:hypothetical protein